MSVVEHYLSAVVDHDWDRLRAVVTDDVVRTGPYGDTYRGRDAYVDFLAELMPRLADYRMDVTRVTYSPDGTAFAELSETVGLDGRVTVTPEVLVFDITPDNVIERITIYTQRSVPA